MSGYILLAACGGVLLLSVVFRIAYSHGHANGLRKASARILALEGEVEAERNYSINLLNSIDQQVEHRIRHWWPQPKDFDEIWLQAEQMANRRSMADAGRLHLPRSDAAAPGTVHRGKLATRRDHRPNRR